MPFDPANPPKFYFIQVQDAGTDIAQETSYLDFAAGFSIVLDAANNAARVTVSYSTLGAVPASSLPNSALYSPLAASANTTIPAGHGFYAPDEYEIGNTFALEIASGAVMEIG